MAAFFTTHAPPGSVLRAEHSVDRIQVRRSLPLARAWRRDGAGALVAFWEAGAKTSPASKPIRPASAL